MKISIPLSTRFAAYLCLAVAGLFSAAVSQAPAGEAKRLPDAKAPQLMFEGGLPQLQIDAGGSKAAANGNASVKPATPQLTGLPNVSVGISPEPEEMPEPAEPATDAYTGTDNPGTNAYGDTNLVPEPTPRSVPFAGCAGTIAGCPEPLAQPGGALSPVPDYVSPLPEPEVVVVEPETAPAAGNESGTGVFVGEGEGLTGKMIGDILDGELLKQEAPGQGEILTPGPVGKGAGPSAPSLPEPPEQPAAKPEDYKRPDEPSELEVDKKGPPADPFRDLPKYVEVLVPQNTLAFKSEVLLKKHGEPTFENLEMEKETIQADLLDKYNNWLASAGQIGRVEMVLSKPVRYARDGSWVKGEFNQIVHDIYGRRLPDYETEYYVIVVSL